MVNMGGKKTAYYDDGTKQDEAVHQNSFFSTPEEKVVNKDTSRRDKINDYLLTVVSGKKESYSDDSISIEGGNLIVSFKELQELVDRGCNIIKAECLYVDENVPDGSKDMISIEYERVVKKSEMRSRI